MARDEFPFPGVPVWQNANRMSGVLCFENTRVPVITLFEYIEKGCALNEFLDAFEGVTRDQAVAVLDFAKQGMLLKAA